MQILLSKSIFKKLENRDADEQIIYAELLTLRRLPAFNVFNRKYYATFLDEEGVKREFKISWVESEKLKTGSHGELLYKGNVFISFSIGSD